MTRKEAEHKVVLMVEDYCKGFAHRMNDEFCGGPYGDHEFRFQTVDKFVSKDVKSLILKGMPF